jgi:hypothetical protein
MKAHLGEDEELLWDMATDMEPEDGHIPSNSRAGLLGCLVKSRDMERITSLPRLRQ